MNQYTSQCRNFDHRNESIKDYNEVRENPCLKQELQDYKLQGLQLLVTVVERIRKGNKTSVA